MTERHSLTAAILAVSLISGAGTAASPQTGDSASGGISGRVVATSSPDPIARALVTVSGPGLPKGMTVITDEEGRFTLRRLPPGSFTVSAARPAYITTAYGARRPGRPGTPVTLASGQRVTDLTIALARGAAIEGIVRDQYGDPMAGIDVVITSATHAGPAPLAAPTDDRGVYRAYGLPPGQYLVMARVAQRQGPELSQRSDAEIDALISKLQLGAAGRSQPGAIAPLAAPPAGRGAAAAANPPTYGYAPVYYPGTPSVEEAVPITVTEGEERGAVDITLRLFRNMTIEGHVSFDGGPLPSGTTLTLSRARSPDQNSTPLVAAATTAHPDSAGAFRFAAVAPGSYRVTARAMTVVPVPSAKPAGLAAPPAIRVTGSYWAVADLTLTGTDISGLTLRLQPGMRLSGRVMFDGRTRTPPVDLTSVRLRLIDASAAAPPGPIGATQADGTFEITGILPGIYGMVSAWSDDGWWLRSVEVGGQDILDVPIEFGAGDVTGAVVRFTDRRTELSGSLLTASNLPAPEHFIVAFPADRSFWGRASRRVQATRPTTTGQFWLRDLPPGDYLVAALTDLEPTDLTDPTFLGELVAAAVPVRLAEGERTTQDLKLSR